jgi:hypothetical protein
MVRDCGVIYKLNGPQMALAPEELSNHDLRHQAFIEQNIGGEQIWWRWRWRVMVKFGH